jgi:CRP-like cAMP-binding protein
MLSRTIWSMIRGLHNHLADMPIGQPHLDDHPLAPLLRRLRLHSQLASKDERSILSLPFTRASREQYSYIIREGDCAKNCAVLFSGFAERHRLSANGGRQILAIYIAGDPLNLDQLFLPTADDALQTLKASELAFIKHEHLLDLMGQRPSIARALMTTALVDASIFREWTINVGRRDARTRIAHLLCELAFRMEAQGLRTQDMLLPLTQYHIADATGLTPVHVNRTLKAMKSDGLLSAKGGFFGFPDWRRLREIADFSPQYLHADGDGWSSQ